jgi:predicted adenine nucleotide alpha hydrolase (AANH) superfamily ATPase
VAKFTANYDVINFYNNNLHPSSGSFSRFEAQNVINKVNISNILEEKRLDLIMKKVVSFKIPVYSFWYTDSSDIT